MLPVNSRTDFFTCPRQANREGNGSARSTCSRDHNLMATHSLSVITFSILLQSTDTSQQVRRWVSQDVSYPVSRPQRQRSNTWRYVGWWRHQWSSCYVIFQWHTPLYLLWHKILSSPWSVQQDTLDGIKLCPNPEFGTRFTSWRFDSC